MNARTNPAILTTAGALAAYETACAAGTLEAYRAAADALAAVLAKGKPAARKPKAPAGRFDMTAPSLAKALRLACKVVDRSSVAEITRHALLEAAGDVLTITTNNLDQEVRVSVDAPGVGSWSHAVEAHALLRALSKATGLVTFTRGEAARLEVTVGGATVTLIGRPASDFPRLSPPDQHGAATFDMPAAAFADILRFASPAISTEETRYYLNGVYLHLSGQALRAVATDGHRLALADTATPDALDEFPAGILPHGAVTPLLDALTASEAVSVEWSSAKARFFAGPVTVTTKLIDGSFPDYQRVIPKTNAKAARFDRKAMRDAVARVSANSDSKARATRFAFTEDAARLSCKSLGGATAAATVDIAGPKNALEVGFNAAYVIDALDAYTGVEVTMAMDDAASPAVLTVAEQPGRLVLLMPLRV